MFGDARDNKDYKGSKSTMPPKTRSGATYPGGRSLRRALKNLGRRKNAYSGASNKKGHQQKAPGSMKS